MPKICPIVLYGDPVLETPAAPVTKFDDELKQLVEDMFASMYEAQGVGLAAPQIGVAKRVAVVDITFKKDPEARLVLVNPEIVKTEGKQSGNEGCLSLPEFREGNDIPADVMTRIQVGDVTSALRELESGHGADHIQTQPRV